MLLQESRVQPRNPAHQETRCRLLMAVGGVVSPITIKNISASGIGLVLHHPFEAGTSLTVELINSSKRFQHALLVRVVYARPLPNSTWSVGFVFANPLGDEALQALL